MTDAKLSYGEEIEIFRAEEARLNKEVALQRQIADKAQTRAAAAERRLSSIQGILDDYPTLIMPNAPDLTLEGRLHSSLKTLEGVISDFQEFQGGHQMNPTDQLACAAYFERMRERRVRAREELKSLRAEREALKAALESERQKPIPPTPLSIVSDVDGKVTLTVGTFEFVFAPGTNMLSLRNKP